MSNPRTTIRIGHLADIHLDESRANWPEQVACVNAIADLARRCDVLAICGDIVEPRGKRHARAKERKLMRSLVRAAVDSGTRVIVIDGNHDVPGDWAHLEDIQNQNYTGPLVRYISEPQSLRVAFGSGPEPAVVYVSAVPYQINANGADAATLAALSVLPPAGQNADLATRPIMLYHGDVKGARYASGQHLPEAEPALDLDALAGRASVVLAGHLHNAQTIRTANPDAPALIYPGSPWPHDHGEEEGEHGFLIHHYDLDAGRIVSSERHALPYAPRITIALRYTPAAGLVLASSGEPADPAAILAANPGAHIRARIEHPRGAELPEWPALAAQLTRAGAASVRRQSIIDAATPAAVPALAADESTGRAAPRTVAELLRIAADNGAIVPPEHVSTEWLQGALDSVPPRTTSEGYGDGSQAVGVRRFVSLTVDNVGAWAGRRETIDLSDRAGIIRIHGDNGSGKTSLLTFIGPGLAYGACPSRGPISTYAAPGVGFFEVELIDGAGRHVRARVTMRAKPRTDGGRGLDVVQSGEIWLDEQPLADIDGKISRARQWLQAQVYGPQEAYYLLVHASQRTAARASQLPASLEEATPAQRDALFRWLLGLDAIDAAQEHATAQESALALAARDYAGAVTRADEAATAAAAAEQRAAEDAERAKSTAQIEASAAEEMQRAWQASEAARQALAEKSTLLIAAQKRAAEAQAARIAGEQLAAARLALTAADAEAARAAAEAERAAEALRAAELAAAEPALMAQRKAELRAAYEAAKRAQDTALLAYDRAKGAVDAAEVRKVQAVQAHLVADQALSVAPDGTAERAALAGAEQRAAAEQTAADNEAAAKAAQLDQANKQNHKAEAAHRAALQSAVDARKALEAAKSAANSLQSVGCAALPGGVLPCRFIDDARKLAATIAAQREAVASAESAEQAAAESSEAALAERNNAAVAAATAQARAGECRQKHAAAIAEARRAVTDAERAYATSEREAMLTLAQRTAAVQAADAAEEAARIASQRFDEATAAEREAHRAFAAAPEPTGEHAAAIAEARTAHATAQHRANQTQHEARQAEARAAAAAQEANRHADALSQGKAQVVLEMMQAAELEARTKANAAAVKATQTNEAHAAARNTASADRATAARSHGAATQARAQADQLAAHAAQLAEQAHEAKRWSWLAGALRRLASLTVDASRAAIEARINAFLARCWGARFSVALEPETINKGGESTRRQYEIVVTDADCEGQQDRAFATYCGGEQVALRQAIQWALLLLAAERTPAQWGVAIIDEADAALSDAAQLDWQNMLAALVATSGLAQVYTVTHRGLDVASGTIELERPGAGEF
jgi:DNA repair exonuclease SbcCD ATPase subunit